MNFPNISLFFSLFLVSNSGTRLFLQVSIPKPLYTCLLPSGGIEARTLAEATTTFPLITSTVTTMVVLDRRKGAKQTVYFYKTEWDKRGHPLHSLELFQIFICRFQNCFRNCSRTIKNRDPNFSSHVKLCECKKVTFRSCIT